MPRDLGKRTPKSEMEKYGKEWGLANPPPDWKVMALHNKGMTAGQIAKELETTSTYVEGTVARLNPVEDKYIEARPAFKYAHETIVPMNKINKEHPGATVRSVTAGSHVLRIAYWNHVNSRHANSQLQSVLHPREPGKCNFVDELRKSGKLKELLEKGRMPIKNISPFNGKVQYLNCPICHNPSPVSKANLRVRCNVCGTQLLSVRIKKSIKRR